MAARLLNNGGPMDGSVGEARMVSACLEWGP
jgi:hypothetical protein